MPSLVDSYSELAPSATALQVAAVLCSIAQASPFSIDTDDRTRLISLILDDLNSPRISTGESRLSLRDASLALSALKSLGKHPAGAAALSTPENLSALLALTRTLQGDFEACCEALRCIANTLLLIEGARMTWIGPQVRGGEPSVQLLEKSSSPDYLFLASRILFLCTASSAHAASFIISLIEDKPSPSSGRSASIVDIISSRLDLLTTAILGGVKMSKEAMTDLLKFTFNLLAHYPKLVDCDKVTDLGAGEGKVMGEYWSERLDGILPPLIRAFNTLPPTFPSPLAPPLTHIIHSLITTPITPHLHNLWFPPDLPTSPSSTSSSSSSGNGHGTGYGHSRKSTSTPASTRQSPTITSDSLPSNSNSNHASNPSTSTSPKLEPAKPGALDRALNLLNNAGRRMSSRPTSPMPGHGTAHFDTLQRAYDLFELSLAHHLPGTADPDSPSVIASFKSMASTNPTAPDSLDDALTPLTMLLVKCALADMGARRRLAAWLLPRGVEERRGEALESRADTLGRCLRLMGSVRWQRMKDAVGEMLFVVCDSDPSQLSAQVGYGNVAGFLFNKGVLSAPAPPPGGSSSTAGGASITELADDEHINPITGRVEKETDRRNTAMEEMTEEEKEAEAEKLFYLFDRLEKSGALSPNQNPVRRAMQNMG